MCPADTGITYLPYDDYAQSANTLFHFVTKPDYLEAILKRRAIIPRYCIETIDYLNIHNGTQEFREVAILQKCFCDIPFHKLADTFSVKGIGSAYDSLSATERAELEKSNTHFAYYGEYAIAFSKSWGERNRLQPVHYLNINAPYAKDFSSLFEVLFSNDDIPDIYSQDILNRLAYIKPLRGIMKRRIKREDSSPLSVELYKNFHDECEWRYVPSPEIMASLEMESVLAAPGIISMYNEINKGLENERYRALWLDYSYDDIRYIIVPDLSARIETIKTILDLPATQFNNQEDIPMQKNILISKILVLSEIRKDW